MRCGVEGKLWGWRLIEVTRLPELSLEKSYQQAVIAYRPTFPERSPVTQNCPTRWF